MLALSKKMLFAKMRCSETLPSFETPALGRSFSLPVSLLPLSGILVVCVFSYFPIQAGVFMEVNDLGFVATILFVLVPSVFLIILYIQTASRQGGKE